MNNLQNYLAASTIVLLLATVLTRAWLMKRRGIQAMHFGALDKKDFLIPPFAFLYFYLVFAAAFRLPTVNRQEFIHSEAIAWIGAFSCVAGLGLFWWSILSFGQSFRVGIDVDRPGRLITTGIIAFSRNPMYLAFALVLIGQFLVFSNWILLLYIGAASWLFHRQVLREEEYLTPNRLASVARARRGHCSDRFVRYGVLPPGDPLIEDSLRVIDAVLKGVGIGAHPAVPVGAAEMISPGGVPCD